MKVWIIQKQEVKDIKPQQSAVKVEVHGRTSSQKVDTKFDLEELENFTNSRQTKKLSSGWFRPLGQLFHNTNAEETSKGLW